MNVEMGVFLTFGGALILIYLMGRTLLVPLKSLLKLLLNSLIGGILLLLINSFGAVVGITIPLNGLNAVTVGVLGLPGLIMLLLFCN